MDESENVRKMYRRRFLEGLDFDPLNDFLYGELHIILKSRNVKMYE